MLQARLCRATPCPLSLQNCEVYALLLKATEAGYCRGRELILATQGWAAPSEPTFQHRLPLAGSSVGTEDTGLRC